MPPETIQELLLKIKSEDTTAYLALIDKINTDKLEAYEIKKLVKPLTNAEVLRFTDNQLKLLRSMTFRRGGSLSIYAYREAPNPFEVRYNAVNGDWRLLSDISTLPKEDLIYLSDYHRAKWRKANPSRTNVKGTQFTFKMDMFSLQIFKNSITKGFLRTEAKNFIVKVNQAFNDSPETNDQIKIRNKFYALILDNTEIHTKTLINELVYTRLYDGTNYYVPDTDEALVIHLPYAGGKGVSYATPECMQTYSTDLNLVTHNNGMELDRDNNRLLSASSMLLSAYVATKCEVYKELSIRMLANLPPQFATKALTETQAVAILRTILKKENNE